MASKYRKKYDLPEGFYDILQDYSREVLRDQPLDIIEFSYLYFKAQEEVSNLTLKNYLVQWKVMLLLDRLSVGENRFIILMHEISRLKTS